MKYRNLSNTGEKLSAIARGLVTATVPNTDDLAQDDFRRMVPRFAGESMKNNQQLVDEFASIAKELNATPAQLAIAWVLAQGEDIIPIPGTTKRKYLEKTQRRWILHFQRSSFNALKTWLQNILIQARGIVMVR